MNVSCLPLHTLESGIVVSWVKVAIVLDEFRRITETVLVSLRLGARDWNESDYNVSQVFELVTPLTRLSSMAVSTFFGP